MHPATSDPRSPFRRHPSSNSRFFIACATLYTATATYLDSTRFHRATCSKLRHGAIHTRLVPHPTSHSSHVKSTVLPLGANSVLSLATPNPGHPTLQPSYCIFQRQAHRPRRQSRRIAPTLHIHHSNSTIDYPFHTVVATRHIYLGFTFKRSLRTRRYLHRLANTDLERPR
jgi:hypothetical protein